MKLGTGKGELSRRTGDYKHLPPHRGPYKGVMRYHLGLLIPEPAEQCGIRVDTQTRHWAEGASLIFDNMSRLPQIIARRLGGGQSDGEPLA